jgi:phage N-6-adenine-methyltransferase
MIEQVQVIEDDVYVGMGKAERAGLQALAGGIRQAAACVLRDIELIGEGLLDAQARLSRHAGGQGLFLRWLRQEFSWSQAQAYRLMALARRPEFLELRNSPNAPAMSVLFLLASGEQPYKVAARREFAARHNAGEHIGLTQAKEILARHRAAYVEVPIEDDEEEGEDEDTLVRDVQQAEPATQPLRDGHPPAPADRERYIEWHLADRHKEALRGTPYANNVVLLHELAQLSEDRQDESVAELLRTLEQVRRGRDSGPVGPTIVVPGRRTIAGEPSVQGWSDVSGSGEAGGRISDSYGTPPYIVAMVRAALGGTIELDACSTAADNAVVGAERYFTREQDGLLQEWRAGAVYVNPPYSQPNIGRWVAKALAERREGRAGQVIFLLPLDPSTGWFYALADCEARIALLRKRVAHLLGGVVRPGTEHPSLLVYLGDDGDRFNEAVCGHAYPARLVACAEPEEEDGDDDVEA